jgi:hypothetical protein
VDEGVVVIHPLQFLSLNDCFRHARRYRFDPLLYKLHRARYRSSIEVKRVGPLTIHRPQHYIALLDFVALVGTIGCLVGGNGPAAISGLLLMLLCGCFFRFKYQGIRSLRVYLLHETAGFTVLPFAYLAAIVRGCVQYRSVGVLL